MAWTNVKTVAAVALAAVMGISVTTVAVRQFVRPKLAAAADPGDWIWEANAQTLEQAPPLLLLQPSGLPATGVPFDRFGKNRYLARGKTLKELFGAIWSQKNSEMQMIFLAPLPEDKFDCLVTLRTNKWWEALESEIHQRFHLVAQYETRGTATVVVVKKVN